WRRVQGRLRRFVDLPGNYSALLQAQDSNDSTDARRRSCGVSGVGRKTQQDRVLRASEGLRVAARYMIHPIDRSRSLYYSFILCFLAAWKTASASSARRFSSARNLSWNRVWPDCRPLFTSTPSVSEG